MAKSDTRGGGRLARLRRWAIRLSVAAPILIALAVGGFFALSARFPYPEWKIADALGRRQSALVTDREGRLLRSFLGEDDSRLHPTEAADVSPHVIAALIAVEDERFHLHPGVDPISVARAAYGNLRRGRIVSGASTITMQVVRLVEPRPRTYRSKGIEAFRALQLERIRSKEEILTLYLNLAPFGGNLIGIEAASQAWFGRHASDLSLSDAALLAGVVQAPSRLRPDRHPDRARDRRNHVLRRMQTCGFISEEELAVALRRPVEATVHRMPFDAPHFTRMLRRRYPARQHLRSTIDRRIQGTAETALRAQVDALRDEGVTNGAVVVIENATNSVRALVGSCDFFSVLDCGQVNGATALRSPGSALKPFAYALAFERGLATPATVLPDVPVSYAGYAPVNYDHEFHGPVTARVALTHSYNVPAVGVVNRVGLERFHALLISCGLDSLRGDPHQAGLPLVLGARSVTLLELTNAYAALARLGVAKPIRLLEDEPLHDGARVLSPGAAWLAADVLCDTGRPGGAWLWKSGRAAPRMAWKTGTSWGHRDAWTVAYTPEYTVGVWIGNFSGRPSAALIGVKAAAPVAARILDRLLDGRAPTWYERPGSVIRCEVCAVSGMPAGEHCASTQSAWMLRDALASRRRCSVHRRVAIDDATGRALCPLCRGERPCHHEVLEDWPVEVSAWLRAAQPDRPLMPPHREGCAAARCGPAGPHILSPAEGERYTLIPGAAHQQLLLRAASGADRLHWFVDDALLASARPDQRIFWPLARGRHRIVCSDAAGRTAAVVIHVEGR